MANKKLETQEIADFLADEILTNRPFNPHPLLPASVERKKLQMEIQNELNICFDRIIRGTVLMFTRLEVLEHHHPGLLTKEVRHELDQIGHPQNEIEDTFEDPKSFKEIFGISDETLKVCTQAAVDYYNHQEYSEAADVFFILGILEPTIAFFWKGLGNANYFMKHYEDAIKAYAACALINPADPMCHFYAAHCYEGLGKLKEAIRELNFALEITHVNSEFHDLEAQALAFLQELQHKT